MHVGPTQVIGWIIDGLSFNPKPKPFDGNIIFIIYAQWVPFTKFVHAINELKYSFNM